MPNLSEAIKREALKRQFPELAQMGKAKQDPKHTFPATDRLLSNRLLQAISKHMNTLNQGGGLGNLSSLLPAPNHSARVSLLLSQRMRQQRHEDQLQLTSLRAGCLHKTSPRSSVMTTSFSDYAMPISGAFESPALIAQSPHNFELLRDHLELLQQHEQRRLCRSPGGTFPFINGTPSLPAVSQFSVQDRQAYVTELLRSSPRYY